MEEIVTKRYVSTAAMTVTVERINIVFAMENACRNPILDVTGQLTVNIVSILDVQFITKYVIVLMGNVKLKISVDLPMIVSSMVELNVILNQVCVHISKG